MWTQLRDRHDRAKQDFTCAVHQRELAADSICAARDKVNRTKALAEGEKAAAAAASNAAAREKAEADGLVTATAHTLKLAQITNERAQEKREEIESQHKRELKRMDSSVQRTDSLPTLKQTASSEMEAQREAKEAQQLLKVSLDAAVAAADAFEALERARVANTAAKKRQNDAKNAVNVAEKRITGGQAAATADWLKAQLEAHEQAAASLESLLAADDAAVAAQEVFDASPKTILIDKDTDEDNYVALIN